MHGDAYHVTLAFLARASSLPDLGPEQQGNTPLVCCSSRIPQAESKPCQEQSSATKQTPAESGCSLALAGTWYGPLQWEVGRVGQHGFLRGVADHCSSVV